MSALEMAPALIAAPFTGGAGTLAILGAQAAGAKAGELGSQGVSAGESLSRGLLSGAIEIATERIPIKNLVRMFRGSGGASLLKNMAKQAGMEATEESASYALNYAADLAAQDPNAEFSLQEMLESAAVGALVGGGLGGGASMLGSVYTPRNNTSSVEIQNPLNQAIRNAKQEKNSEVQRGFERAQEKVTQEAEQQINRIPAVSSVTPSRNSSVPVETQNVENVKSTSSNTETDSSRRARYQRKYQDFMERAQAAANDPSLQTTENYQRLQEELFDIQSEYIDMLSEERVSGGQVSSSYNLPENHIDNRTASDVGKKNVKAFQFDHPQLHQYYAEAAQSLIDDANFSLDTQSNQKGKGTVVRYSEPLKKATEMGLTRQDIIQACENIIADKGQENYAAAKRVEIILDDMLSNGYIPNSSLGDPDTRVPANQDYISAKEQIPGSVRQDSFEAYKNKSELALDLGEVTEDQLRQEWEAMQGQSENSLPEGMGAMSAGGAGAFDAWQASTPEGGFHPINEQAASATAEERGRAPIEVPKINRYGMLTSKTASTLLNANITPNQFAVELEDSLANGDFSRMSYSDQKAERRAEMAIREKGFQRTKEDWLADIRSGKFSKDLTATGITLYNNAVNSGDAIAAMDIASEMISYGKSLGQSLQAFNIINKMTPSGQLYTITKTAENLEDQIRKNAKINKETGLPEYDGIEVDSDLAQKFLDAETTEEREYIRQEIYRDIASQVPATWKDKVNAWNILLCSETREHTSETFSGIWGLCLLE